MAALGALAPLSMNIQSDALPTYALPHIALKLHPISFNNSAEEPLPECPIVNRLSLNIDHPSILNPDSFKPRLVFQRPPPPSHSGRSENGTYHRSNYTTYNFIVKL